MAEFKGEKTEQPTQRRLEEAWKQGRFARSAEVQTAAVLLAALGALWFTGQDAWRLLVLNMVSVLGHLHELPVSHTTISGYAVSFSASIGQIVWPILGSVVVASLFAGAAQSQFRTASEILEINWQRVNPAAGFQRLFSFRAAMPTALAILKLGAIVGLAWGTIRAVLGDPIFHSAVDQARIGGFLAGSTFQIALKITLALGLIAAIDYTYQVWRTHRDLMMTKEELKDEMKHSDGNPQIKAAQRQRRQAQTKRKMLAAIPTADVIVTNPIHLAVALRYDRRTMGAPKIVAKGSRLNAQRIREIARQHQVPILENKPLARLLFKHGKIGAEIPAALYSAVAEVLAWVYRVNAYRYYRESAN